MGRKFSFDVDSGEWLLKHDDISKYSRTLLSSDSDLAFVLDAQIVVCCFLLL